MKTAVLASLVASAVAFAPAQNGGKSKCIVLEDPRTSVRNLTCPSSVFVASKATSLNAEKSPAVPFLPYAQNLKGYIGEDIGFDPLRISDYVPMDYLRESELK